MWLTFGVIKTTIESQNLIGDSHMQFTVRMTDEYREKIDILAKKMGLKKSDIARLAIKQFIEENIDDETNHPFQKVRNLVGSVESGIKDLGQSHREYIIQNMRKKS